MNINRKMGEWYKKCNNFINITLGILAMDFILQINTTKS